MTPNPFKIGNVSMGETRGILNSRELSERGQNGNRRQNGRNFVNGLTGFLLLRRWVEWISRGRVIYSWLWACHRLRLDPGREAFCRSRIHGRTRRTHRVYIRRMLDSLWDTQVVHRNYWHREKKEDRGKETETVEKVETCQNNSEKRRSLTANQISLPMLYFGRTTWSRQ